MKLVAILLAVLSMSSLASAQEVEMRVFLKDGTVLRIDTDSILTMSVTPIVYPKLRIMNMSRVSENDGELAVDSTYMDSIRFERNQHGMRLAWSDTNYYRYYIAPVSGVNGTSIVDTIKFSLHNFNTSVQSISRLDNPDPHQLISTAWNGSTIYASYPMQKFVLDNEHTVLRDSLFGWEGNHPMNVELNKSGDKMVYTVPSLSYHPAAGRVVEHDMVTGTFNTLPLGTLITRAKYVSNSNDLIYYTMGSYDYDHNPNPDDAGYYYLNRSTGDTTLLVKHLPVNFEDDIVNGFDVNHAGTKFIYTKVDGLERAILREFDLKTKTIEILPVDFPKMFARTLWVQYSNDDSKILYSLSNLTHIPEFMGDSSEVGIINRSNYIRQVINVAPHDMRGFLVPYPRWSPDDTAICYGAAMFRYYVQTGLEPFNLYVKKL